MILLQESLTSRGRGYLKSCGFLMTDGAKEAQACNDHFFKKLSTSNRNTVLAKNELQHILHSSHRGRPELIVQPSKQDALIERGIHQGLLLARGSGRLLERPCDTSCTRPQEDAQMLNQSSFWAVCSSFISIPSREPKGRASVGVVAF